MVVRADVQGGAALKAFGTDFAAVEDRLGKSKLNEQLKKLGVGLGLMAGGFAGVKGAFGAAEAAGDFELKLAGVQAVMRATPPEMAALRDAAIEAGIATQFSPQEAVEGLLSLATAGQTSEEAIKTLIPALDLAAGSLGQLNPEAASSAIIGTLNAYGWGAEKAGDVTDRLLRITQMTNFQARDFANGLDKAAAAGAVFGQDFNDVLITMGLLRNRNIDASSSATSVREATRRLASDFGAQKAIQEAGVKVFDEQTGKMRQMVDVILDMNDKTSAMNDEQRNSIVVRALGARGLLAFNAVAKAQFRTMQDGKLVTLEGRDAIAAMRAEMDKTSGTAETFREKLLNTFQGQKTILQGVMQTFAVVVGEPFARVFKPIVSLFQNVMTVVTNGIKNLSPELKAVGAVIFLVGSIVAIGVGAWMALTAVLTIFGTTVGAVFAGFIALAAPVLAVIAGIAAAIGLVVVAWQNNLGGIRDTFREVFGAVGAALGNLFGALGALWEQAKPVLGAFIGMLATGVGGALSVVGKIFGAVIVPVIELLGVLFRAFARVVEVFHLGAVAAGLFGAVGKAIAGVFWAVGKVIDGIAWGIDKVVGLVRGAADILGLGAQPGAAPSPPAPAMAIPTTSAATTMTLAGFGNMPSITLPEIPDVGAVPSIPTVAPEETPQAAALQAQMAALQAAPAAQALPAGEWEIVITEPVELTLDGKNVARTVAKLRGKMRRREEFATAVDEEAAD